MPGTDHVSAINIHICRRVVPGREGGCVPSRSAAYENQALKTEYVKLPALTRFFPRILSDLPKFPPNLLQLQKKSLLSSHLLQTIVWRFSYLFKNIRLFQTLSILLYQARPVVINSRQFNTVTLRDMRDTCFTTQCPVSL